MHSPIVEWGHLDNRPALRSLARLAQTHLHRQQLEPAIELGHYLLSINPTDNHGFRAIVINHFLRHGESQQAASIASRYPDDMLCETCYGQALAHYCLGQHHEANAAIAIAIERLPKVAKYLLKARSSRPKPGEYGIQIGGDEQAWLYREEMRDTWLQIPGALDWLTKAAQKR